MSGVVLITGASAGIGREEVILPGKQDHTVYAGTAQVPSPAGTEGAAP